MDPSLFAQPTRCLTPTNLDVRGKFSDGSSEGGPEPQGSGGAQLPTRGEGTRRIHSGGEGRRVPPLFAQRTSTYRPSHT
jgi:hypothetical protein